MKLREYKKKVAGLSEKPPAKVPLELNCYAPGEPNTHLGSENPKEYLSLALYLTLPVSKSASIEVLIGDLANILNPFGASVLIKKASVSVK
jgi:hypothetical protein